MGEELEGFSFAEPIMNAVSVGGPIAAQANLRRDRG